MQISPKTGPGQEAPNTPTTASPAQKAARERAMQKFIGAEQEAPAAAPPQGARPQTPDLSALIGAPQVQNQNSVSPEEMGAVRPSTDSVETQNNTSEGAEAPAATPAPEPLSSQYAQLARKEKAIRAEVQKIKAEKEAIAKREVDLKAQLEKEFETKLQAQLQARDESWKTRFQKNPNEVMAETGLTYDQLTEAMVNAPSPESIAQKSWQEKVEAQLKAKDKAIEDLRNEYKASQQDAYKQALNQFKVEAQELVDQDPAYEMIKLSDSVADVVDLIEREFKASGKVLTVEQAAQAVEEHLMEEANSLLSKSKKLQQKFTPSQAVPAQQQQVPGKAATQPAKTLTNAIAGSRKLNARERAILAMEGKLQK